MPPVVTAPADAHIQAQIPVPCMPAVWCAACWISWANAPPVVAPSMMSTETASTRPIGRRNLVIAQAQMRSHDQNTDFRASLSIALRSDPVQGFLGPAAHAGIPIVLH